MKRSVTVNYSALRPGLWFHFRSYGFCGRGIRFFLAILAHRSGLKGCWGNHDAILIRQGDEWYVGESTAKGGVLTPLSEYLADIAKGAVDMRVYQVRECPVEIELQAATNWLIDHKGRMYDFKAIFLLAFKCIFGRLNDRLADWEFADFCTEATNDAYADAYTTHTGIRSTHPLLKKHPTPLTVEIRAGQAGKSRAIITMQEITETVIQVVDDDDKAKADHD